MEYASDNIRVSPNRRDNVFFLEEQNSNMQQSSGFDRGVKKQGCWLHRLIGEAGEHPIWRCREFLSKNVQERIQLVRSNRACQLCLLLECPGVANVSDCKSKFRCRENRCGKNHNRLLHVEPIDNRHPSDDHSNNASTILPIQTL